MGMFGALGRAFNPMNAPGMRKMVGNIPGMQSFGNNIQKVAPPGMNSMMGKMGMGLGPSTNMAPMQQMKPPMDPNMMPMQQTPPPDMPPDGMMPPSGMMPSMNMLQNMSGKSQRPTGGSGKRG